MARCVYVEGFRSGRCLLVIFACLELTSAFAGARVCDCGIAWRRMVLGCKRPGAGAKAFRGGGEEGAAILDVRVCDAVVTPCDLRSLEMARPRNDSLLLLCLG